MISEKKGNLLTDFGASLAKGLHLAVMPIARTDLVWATLEYPAEITFYPKGHVDLGELNPHENSKDSSNLAERVSALSGIDADTIFARAATDNIGSIRVLQKCGLKSSEKTKIPPMAEAKTQKNTFFAWISILRRKR